MFDIELIRVRVISFALQAGAVLLTAVVASVLSPEFREIVVSHAGDGTVGFLIVSTFDALLKHVRNVNLVSKFGSASGARERAVLL